MKIDYARAYVKHVRRLLRGHNRERAMELSVGDNFESFGALMRDILIQAGLGPRDYLIDVGCGAGRVTKALTEYLEGPYLGPDLVPELLKNARQIAHRGDWRFELVSDIAIPERNAAADMVCFFSVFTHLLHEDSYRYLSEAYRVLKPGGRVVFSFLEFTLPGAWVVFEHAVGAQVRRQDEPHTQFIGRDGIAAWAAHLGFQIEAIYDGDKPVVGSQPLGQSVCVLRKPVNI